MADLLDIDSLAKTSLLRVVSFEVDAGGSIRDAVSRRGWVVAGKARWLELVGVRTSQRNSQWARKRPDVALRKPGRGVDYE